VAGAEGGQRLRGADLGQFGAVPESALRGRGHDQRRDRSLAKAFSDRGITDGVQVNSALPGPVMTGRRRSYLQHWAPLHNMTVEEATANFPQEAGIARYGEPEEIAELMAFLVSPGARRMTGSTLRMDGGEAKSI
jgi:3-oxoacyl-[acyl-carrier protein] reductase